MRSSPRVLRRCVVLRSAAFAPSQSKGVTTLRLRTVLVGLALLAGPFSGVADASPAPPAPEAGHEQACNRAHNSTAPPEADEAFHERVPRAALNQLCDPHRGHEDDSDPD